MSNLASKKRDMPWMKGEMNHRWKGGKYLQKGYLFVLCPEHPRANKNGYVQEHILKAERALEKPLPDKAVVHHHTPEQLVICQDQTYHFILHLRERAYKACGDPHWLKCEFCKEYDDPANLTISGKHYYHKNCAALYRREQKGQKR